MRRGRAKRRGGGVLVWLREGEERPRENVTTSGKILVTGGTGYIGSHTCVALIESGFEPIVVDNLSNSHPAVLDRIAGITKHRPAFYKADVRDVGALDRILAEHKISAVIHFAGLKAVGESVAKPLLFYRNNVEGSCGYSK